MTLKNIENNNQAEAVLDELSELIIEVTNLSSEGATAKELFDKFCTLCELRTALETYFSNDESSTTEASQERRCSLLDMPLMKALADKEIHKEDDVLGILKHIDMVNKKRQAVEPPNVKKTRRDSISLWYQQNAVLVVNPVTQEVRTVTNSDARLTV